MILELADIRIRPGDNAAFEEAIERVMKKQSSAIASIF